MACNIEEQQRLIDVAEGSESAFAELFRQYHGHVFATSKKLLFEISEAEEIVQEVFLKLWRSRTRLKEIEHFPSYLNKIALHSIYSSLRKQNARIRYLSSIESDKTQMAESPSETYSAKEMRRILDEAVLMLPEKQRKTYLLIKEHGYKREQVAQHLAVSPETVKSNLEIAVKRVKEYCEARMGITPLILIAAFILDFS